MLSLGVGCKDGACSCLMTLIFEVAYYRDKETLLKMSHETAKQR